MLRTSVEGRIADVGCTLRMARDNDLPKPDAADLKCALLHAAGQLIALVQMVEETGGVRT